GRSLVLRPPLSRELVDEGRRSCCFSSTSSRTSGFGAGPCANSWTKGGVPAAFRRRVRALGGGVGRRAGVALVATEAMASLGLFDIEGKRAVVTGGGSGIGTMIARGFVQAGVEVLIASRK